MYNTREKIVIRVILSESSVQALGFLKQSIYIRRSQYWKPSPCRTERTNNEGLSLGKYLPNLKMGVFTYICRLNGDEWSAKQLSGDLEASASSTYELQRKLVKTTLEVDSSGGVQSAFSFITPKSAVFQV